MTEDVLQYIWQTQAFSKFNLFTSRQEALVIYKPGKLNTGSGPDFAEAMVQINGITWAGDIEIHSFASHWDNHQHNSDKAYDKVVLHVVWEEDKPVLRQDGSSIPTLELKHYLDPDWYARYQHLMQSLSAIPCEHYLPSVDRLVISEAIYTALINRLESKASEVLALLAENRGDWEQTAMAWLFAGFGFQKNKAALQQLAQIVEPSVLRKITSEHQMAAYLFGLSGLLPARPTDNYVRGLINEFSWLHKKFNLEQKVMSITWWKFMRLRPANFPTLRLAQLATLLFRRKNILRTILDSDSKSLTNLFEIKHDEFWQRHYHFTSNSGKKLSGMGRQSQDNLLINVVAVLLVAYGNAHGQVRYLEKAVHLLESIGAEENKVIRLWQSFELNPQSAAESQGLIGLFSDFCKKNRCLSCNIGQYITKIQ